MRLLPGDAALSRRVADLVHGYLADLPDGPVWRPPRFAPSAVPLAGTPADAVLDEIAERVMPHPFGNGHPRFFAWVNSPPHPLGVAADAIAAAMNPSVAGGDHAAVHVEREVVRWFAELAGFPPGAGGLLVSGGSTATLTAFAVARHRAAARAGIDVRARGLQGHDRPFVLYLGAEGHGSARKAAELLGLGSEHVRIVPGRGEPGRDAAAGHRLDPAALDRMLASEAGIPVAVMATAGTVNTGEIDDLAAIADVCAAHGVWLHVDASYGGPAVLLLDRFADARAGLARADSVSLDPHKWLYAPVDAGLVLLRDPSLARDAFSLVPPYLRAEGDPWFSEYGFEQTRPFRALKVWALLKHLGVAGYRALIEHDLAVAAHLAAAVARDSNLELLAHGLSVVCFRVAGSDELNRQVLAAVQASGRAYLAGTTVDGAFALRACVVNPATTTADADALLSAVRAALPS
ncbi:pyridoxal-dependent decarboxylase [Dactylosporangium sp. AC04546]|uniref:pyridoxal phosphate-dependent decarboxylase family protein n=1 Tax=Dactylosporangium sp. AC04546 TaxID=2862460 RepID=UPI001EDD02AE|nr:pyridoxal-dependent decarboxylase [Dactylosporangium sp. AC04546]WVK80185.1 pyridoxal-dependent decarboxylase [Dactylosporangium sp. AC04546]